MSGALPRDISEIWGDDPLAQLLIERWGEVGFRTSAIHQLALGERIRKTQVATLQAEYLKRIKRSAP